MKMKRKVSIFEVTVIAIGLAAATSVWADGNGSGYNGPDWSPEAIPVDNDREISAVDVEKAVNTCLLTGRASQGLVSVMQRVAQQTYGNPMPDRVVDYNGGSRPVTDATISVEISRDPSGFALGRTKVGYPFFIWSSGAPASASYCISVGNGPQVGGCLFGVWNAFGTGEGSHQQLRMQLLPGETIYAGIETVDAFPALSYARLIRDKQYDEWGNISSREIVKGLRIHVPKKYATSGSAMPTVNSSTHGPVMLKINYLEYVACLKGELQNIGSSK